MNSELLKRITVEPGKCGGRPCIRGMRMRVTDILQLLSVDASYEEILEDYPILSATTFWRPSPTLRTKPTMSCSSRREVPR